VLFLFVRYKAVFKDILNDCSYYLISAGITFFVSLCYDFLKDEPPEHFKKILEAVVCGFMSFAICGYTSTHCDWLSEFDCLFVSVGIGVIGAGRVSEIALQLIARKLNVTVNNDK